MKLKELLLVSFVGISGVAGFGAQPSKPDFAFPKTVSSNAEKELAAAMKRNDGPATVRALIDWGLAQTRINSDRLDAVGERMLKVQDEVKSPVTKAMIQLLRSGALDSDSLGVDAASKWGLDLRGVSVADWRKVVEADEVFTPTLFDFAVAYLAGRGCAPDTLISEAVELNASNVYPRFYLEYLRAESDDDFLSLYNRFQADDVSIYALSVLARRSYSIDERRRAFELARQWSASHAGSSLESESKSICASMTRPDVNISVRNITAPGAELPVSVHAVCLNRCELEVVMLKPVVKKLRTIPVAFEGTGVFEADTVVNVTLDDYGEYEINVKFSGQTEHRHSARGARVNVTSFLLSRSEYGSKTDVFALNAINGALQTDVELLTERNRTRGQRGGDRYSPAIYNSNGYEPDSSTRVSANVLTDRAIYHPGDTIKFVATLMRAKLQSRSLYAGATVEAELRNVNFEPVGRGKYTSDEFGRITGEFALPSDGLTGRYSLRIADAGSTTFLVSDYKAPTFDVEMNSTRIDSTTVELTGTATGYNGFPIADARVSVVVAQLPRWVWYRSFRNSGGDRVAADTVATDAEGKFSLRVTVPADENLSATATVTSPAGESHDASAFIARRRYFISGDVPPFVLAGQGPRFAVLDSKGENAADVKLDVVLLAAGDSARVVPDATWSNVPSGEYRLEVAAEGADTLTRDNLCIYRTSDAMPPCRSALFVPVHSVEAGSDILAGTSYADSHILYTLWTPEAVIESKWLTPAAGNFFLKPELPDGVDNATLTLTTMRDYSLREETISIRRADVARSLDIEVTSFRNRMVPGEKETWTVKVKDNLGLTARSAVMVDVYSKALDALEPFGWRFNTMPLFGKFFRQSAETAYTSMDNATRTVKAPAGLKVKTAAFNLYGLSWPGMFVVEYSSGVNYVTSPARGVMMKSAVSMNLAEAATDVTVEEDCCDEAVSEAECKADSDAGAVEGSVETPGADNYRLPEVPVALWAPVLTTGVDGTLDIRFEAPDANTAWNVRALAYDSRLLSGLYANEIVASKPVMVQPQLPRFLRAGDRIELRAMVMNNTDSAQTMQTKFEVFNPLTDEIVNSADSVLTINGGASSVVSVGVNAPDVSLLGIRVRATAGRFTDGEQSVIAVLPAEVTVRTGTPLFLPSDSTNAEINVPKGGVMTFTANAVWECITALPGLQTTESKSATSLASVLFSAATARGLLRAYPAIGRAICAWQNEDSALVSRLEKNSDLKIAMLSSTPWPGAAQTIDERMARLDLLFDSKLTERTISNAINDLAKLTRGGGFAWTSDCDEPSEWITFNVLCAVAQLRRLGYAPDSGKLNRMIANAVEYIDREVARAYADDRNSTFIDYVYVRSQFPEVRQSAPARRAAQATVQHIVGHWRDLSVNSLPMAAIVLGENGYAATARQLLESLRQREAWRQTWLNPMMLEAFSRLEPKSAEVETIRNYFIEQKQSTSWGDGPHTSNLIAAVLTSGADWLVPAENALSVTVDGAEVRPDATSSLGEFRIDLPQGGTVAVRKGNFPAWGGVFSCGTDSIAKIDAFASDKLKITRTMQGELKVGSKVTLTLRLEASQPVDFVMVTQPRCAAFEPVDQLPSRIWTFGGSVYREPCSTVTNWFINRLGKGVTEISETFYVTATGDFMLAPAEAQSQLAPEFQAHSSGFEVEVSE